MLSDGLRSNVVARWLRWPRDVLASLVLGDVNAETITMWGWEKNVKKPPSKTAERVGMAYEILG